MNKKQAALFTTFFVSLALAACGGSSDGKPFGGDDGGTPESADHHL